MKSTAPAHIEQKIFNLLGIALIVISSGLLGIWAVRDTIALRNILLVLGSVLSLIYWYLYFKNQKKLSFPDFKNKHFIDFLPTVLIGCMFLWVVLHYFFFSRFPQQQWDELTSTWLRSFLACLIGSATALALRKNIQMGWLLWFGLLVSFVVLFYQYIPKAIEKDSLYAPDFFGGYIYWAKFNGVLAGSILVAGTLGYCLDRLSSNIRVFSEIQDWRPNVFGALYLLISLFLPIYSFIFIFEAINGIAISILILILFIFFYINNTNINYKIKTINIIIKNFLIFISFLLIFEFLISQHVKFSTDLHNIFQDSLLAIKDYQYPNWKNINAVEYPNYGNLKIPVSNTYERVALFLVGMRLLANDPIGIGIARSLQVNMNDLNVQTTHQLYTHSAWIDLGLTYGIIGALIPVVILLILLIKNILNRNLPYKNTFILLSANFLILYLVGEYGFQHGIEILFYFISLISFTCFLIKSK